MKQLALIAGLAIALAGCSKNDSGSVADDAKNLGDSTASALSKAAESTKEQAKEITATATAKAQELIDKAKSLVAEQKFQDASAALDKLSGIALTDEQKTAVENLKEEIKKGVAALKNGTSAVGDLLKK